MVIHIQLRIEPRPPDCELIDGRANTSSRAQSIACSLATPITAVEGLDPLSEGEELETSFERLSADSHHLQLVSASN